MCWLWTANESIMWWFDIGYGMMILWYDDIMVWWYTMLWLWYDMLRYVKINDNSSAWSTNLVSSCCLPVTKGHHWHIHCLSVMCLSCKSYLNKLVKLQKWAIRTVSNSHYRSHTGPFFYKYNVLTVTDMYTLELGTFMYRYSINVLISSFSNYFTK